MGHWEFNSTDPSSVWIDPNQGDQFNNDDVGLGEALVREVIQNSSDAGIGNGPVKVRFQITKLQEQDVEKLRDYLQSLGPHLNACGFDGLPSHEDDAIQVLTIEDFNTKGLTGRYDKRDDDNFTSFWRDLARSNKSGKEGGRWGLGKLVFSSASKMRAFFGLTIRQGDTVPSLMGQAVLRHHDIGNDHYHSHGFWFSKRCDNRLQYPVTDQEKIAAFSKLTGLQRTNQSGLSIVVGFVAWNY